MILKNKFGITYDGFALAREEELFSKTAAKLLFESGSIDDAEVGTFSGLVYIHVFMFGDVYFSSGDLREENLVKDGNRFVSPLYLGEALDRIDSMPNGDFGEIIEKYVEMNFAHPFRQGNCRATRIWLDRLLKQEISQVVDWAIVDKNDYLAAMRRSSTEDYDLKQLLEWALTDEIDDPEIFMSGLDASYFYAGLTRFRTEEL